MSKNLHCQHCNKPARELHQNDEGKYVAIQCLTKAEVIHYPRLHQEWLKAKKGS